MIELKMPINIPSLITGPGRLPEVASKYVRRLLLPLGIAMTLAATPYCRKDKKDHNPPPSSKPGDPPSSLGRHI